MKLIVTGGTGFVGTELVRQALQLKHINSLVVLSRKPVITPEGVDATKLKHVSISDYADYPDNVRKELSGADACIWTVAITPSKSKDYDAETLRQICHSSTLAGVDAVLESGPAKPFRFLYMSGSAAERDQTKTPTPAFMAPYLHLRGETESAVLAAAEKHTGNMEAAVAKPGLITSKESITRSIMSTALRATNITANIAVEEVAASMLQQVSEGFEKDTLTNEDLKHIGQKALAQQT